MTNSLHPKIMAAVERQGEAFDFFVKTNNGRIDSIRERADGLQERIEEIEAKASSPGRTAPTRETLEHKTRFVDWLRSPHDSSKKNALGDFEEKAVTIGSNPGGGFAVPEEIVRNIERLELKFSPVRSLVRVMKASTSDFKHLVNLRGANSGWVGEGDTRTETNTPTLREIVPTMGELYSYPVATEWALDDVFFDLGAWLAEEVAQDFAIAEGTAVLTGDGTNKPTGMLNTTPTTDDDFASPLRAAAAYEFLPSLSASSPAVAEIMPDELISLVFAVNSAYRANGSFVMNSSTAAHIRKLKDNQGRYLWTDGLAAGQPNTLLGYPVSIWEQMADIGTNAFPVAFGDFRRGYLLVDRTQTRITVDSNITTPGKVKYFVRRREGGHVLNGDAVKWLRTTIA